MLKAVVFDDEFIVLKGLKKLINWQDYGIELVGTATDGLSALEMFRSLKPDIIMTDIRMPNIDGLELIQIVQSEAPETMCIVFSGYNEFDYVKRAIKLGVVDYLEKPISIEKIKEGIQKAVERIRVMNEVSDLKQKWQQGLMESLTLDLLKYGEKAKEKWIEQFSDLASRITGITVITCTDDKFKLQPSDHYQSVEIRSGSENIIVIFTLDDYAPIWEAELERVEDAVVGSGRTYSSIEDIAHSYKEAKRALRYGKYLEGTGWIKFVDLGDSHIVHPLLTELEEEILFEMRTGNKEGFIQKLNVYLEQFKKQKLDPEVAEIELLRLLFHGLEVAKETGESPTDLWETDYLPRLELRHTITQDEMAGWLRLELGKMMDWIISVRMKTKHVSVEKAIDYIKQHYGRDLTQQDVASYVNMNAAYFSLLFKEQMGISYIKYLTKVRIEKAKDLLNEGISIQEISEKVGYYHARHFSEVFKKQTGITPGQFRVIGKG